MGHPSKPLAHWFLAPPLTSLRKPIHRFLRVSRKTSCSSASIGLQMIQSSRNATMTTCSNLFETIRQTFPSWQMRGTFLLGCEKATSDRQPHCSGGLSKRPVAEWTIGSMILMSIIQLTRMHTFVLLFSASPVHVDLDISTPRKCTTPYQGLRFSRKLQVRISQTYMTGVCA